MATNTTVPAIPAPTGIERNTERVLSPIKETLDVWAGRQGNPNNRVVTVRELVDLITTDATLSVTISTVPHSHTIYLEKAGGIMTGPLELDDTLKFGATGQTVNDIVLTLTGAGTASQLATAAAIEGLMSGHVGDTDPHGDRSYASGLMTTHESATDPHTGYQKESEKSAASGYASLNASGYVPTGELGSGTPDGTLFLRDDNTWQSVSTGGGIDHGSLGGLLDDDHTQYQLESEKNAASGYAGLNASGYVAPAQLGSGTPDGTKFLRDDNSWQAGGGGITDHGALSGLSDDDHSIYSLADGTRSFTGEVTISANPTWPDGQLNLVNPTTGNATISFSNSATTESFLMYASGSGGTANLTMLGNYATDEYSIDVIAGTGQYIGLHADGSLRIKLDGNGITLWDGGMVSGETVNEITATISAPGDDTTLVTEKAVVDYCATLGGGVTDHGALSGLEDDDHTQYQKESEKGSASGYAGLDASSFVPTANLGSGTADGTVFLRGDQTWAAAGGSGGGLFAEDATSHSIYGGTGAGNSLTTTGLDNFVGGRDAGYAITLGDYNVGIGYNSLRYLSTGSNNTAVGVNALRGYDSNSDIWSYNTAVGVEALYGVLDGSDNNTAVGYQAGRYVKTGDYNTAVGYQAGIMAAAHTAGNSNTCVGARTMTKANGLNYCTCIGDSAGQNLYSGTNAVFVGYQAGVGHTSSSNSGNENVFIGYMVGKNYSSAAYNTIVGTYGFYNNTYGQSNVGLGHSALQYATDVDGNTCVGRFAGRGKSGGQSGTGFNWCVAVGYSAGSNLDSGSDYGVYIGYQAGNYGNGGDYNVYIGYQAGFSGVSIGTHYDNVGIGNHSLYNIYNGYGNVAVGYHSGDILTHGYYNTILGHDADVDNNSRTNAIVIGYGASGTADNYIAMGNTSIAAADCQVSWGTYSDRRLKNSIVDSEIGLDFILGLRTRRFKKNDIKEDVTFDGMIAQEVKEVMDSLGVEFSGWRETGGTQSLQYEAFVMPLINAVKQLKKEIDELKGK